ncbi:MAG: CPBP family intramembrane metalloprotease [Clostridiales bacterium]|jgi:membrane protease YdiL (CAAX protease family)|nr:CPBP family intramembrane metalloprotease [Clostridiales bacterium]
MTDTNTHEQAYKYRPVRFYLTVFALTWLFWVPGIFLGRGEAANGIGMLFMLLGLFVPPVTALIFVLTSKSAALKKDYRQKLVGMFRVKPLVVLAAVISFFLIICASILLSTFFGESLGQFSLTDFSFGSNGATALLTIILASCLEEFGWRGYGEDSIASYCSWWKESIVFGLVWALWHLPLFFIPDTYHYNILQQSPWFALNFFVSIMPLGFIVTWVYVKNNRSIFATVIFHFFVNFLQEKIAMTQTTKCVETLVLFAAAAIVVAANKDLFFEKRHIGRLLPIEVRQPAQ